MSKKFKTKMTLEEFGDFVDEVTSSMCCLTCENCIPIGEGDHVCFEALDDPVLVLEDYEPTDNYFACGGSEYDGGEDDDD